MLLSPDDIVERLCGRLSAVSNTVAVIAPMPTWSTPLGITPKGAIGGTHLLGAICERRPNVQSLEYSTRLSRQLQ